MFDFKKKQGFDVVLIGRACIDFNPVDLNKPLQASTTFKKYLGGSPANIAVGLARLNKKVSFIGKVSQDQFGTFIIDYFKQEAIDTTNISLDKHHHSLGLTFTEIKSPSESSILMYRNQVADLYLNVDDIQEEVFKEAKLLVISGSALSASPSREAVLKSLELAKQTDVKIV
ncbi:MAG: PfkB family carbohydrate kinase, partial [Bacilli bacterium]